MHQEPCENCHPSQDTCSGGHLPAGGWSPAHLGLSALPPGASHLLQGDSLFAEPSKRGQQVKRGSYSAPAGPASEKSMGPLRGEAHSAPRRPADLSPLCFPTSGCSPSSALLPSSQGKPVTKSIPATTHLLLWANMATSGCTWSFPPAAFGRIWVNMGPCRLGLKQEWNWGLPTLQWPQLL